MEPILISKHKKIQWFRGISGSKANLEPNPMNIGSSSYTESTVF